MDNTEPIISVCTGCAGFELGFETIHQESLAQGQPIRFQTIAYVEIGIYPLAHLLKKIQESALDAAPIWTDAHTFPVEPFRGKVGGVIGGIPCQPFSAAGKKKGAKDSRFLYPAFARIVSGVDASWWFIENVEGILTKNMDGSTATENPSGYRVLQHIRDDMEDRGYRTVWGIFSAEEVGAPHRRKRVYIYGQKVGYAPGHIRWLATSRIKRTWGKTGGPSSFRWPAGRTNLQYEWEYPRTMADTKGKHQ